MVLGHPVPETVHDIADDHRVIAVEGIAAAAEIVVLSARGEHIVDAVVHALEAHEGTFAVSLRRVVEHDVQDDLDLALLEQLDQFLELGPLLVIFDRGCIGCIGGKKSHRIIAPVFQKPLSVVGAGIDGLIELKYRHELDGCDAQALEMGDFFNNAGKGAGITDAGGSVAGEAAHVHLIDDGVLHLCAGKIRLFPDEIVFDDTGVIGTRLLGRAPGALSGDRLCIGVQDQLFAVKNKAPGRIVRAVEAVTVFKLFNIELINKDRIDSAGAVALGNTDDRIGDLRLAPEQQQFTGGGMLGIDRKIHAPCKSRGPIEQTVARAHAKTGYLIK